MVAREAGKVKDNERRGKRGKRGKREARERHACV
jgi:hypothetical protein